MNEIQELQTQHNLGRAKNAVQSHLIRKLLVPKIYFDADWNGRTLDVLAIDRAGVGDVHGVILVPWEPGLVDDHGYSEYLERAVSAKVSEFADFPGHFRYLTVVCFEPNKQRWIPGKGVLDQALAADGVGRVGLLYVNLTEADPAVEVLLKPERYRSSKQIVEIADRFVEANLANWEVRE